jgi:excisionase family DNA binding protein
MRATLAAKERDNDGVSMSKSKTLPAQQRVGALKLKPAAHYLSLSKPSIYRLVARGLLKPNRATRHLLFPVAELDRFLRE